MLLGSLSGTVQAANPVWTGGSLVGNNWGDGANLLETAAPAQLDNNIVMPRVQAVLTNDPANQPVVFNPALVSHTATIDPRKTFQTIEGLGGATAFYAGWITAHPYQMEIYTNAFAGLNLSMLRWGIGIGIKRLWPVSTPPPRSLFRMPIESWGIRFRCS